MELMLYLLFLIPQLKPPLLNPQLKPQLPNPQLKPLPLDPLLRPLPQNPLLKPLPQDPLLRPLPLYLLKIAVNSKTRIQAAQLGLTVVYAPLMLLICWLTVPNHAVSEKIKD